MVYKIFCFVLASTNFILTSDQRHFDRLRCQSTIVPTIGNPSNTELPCGERLIAVVQSVPAFTPFIFDRFYRIDTDRSRESGGTGFGLAICQDIMHAHNGEIDVQSIAGKETTFFIRFPMMKADR